MPTILIADDRLEFRTEAVSAGCVGFITKPVDPAVLLDMLRLLLAVEEGSAATM